MELLPKAAKGTFLLCREELTTMSPSSKINFQVKIIFSRISMAFGCGENTLDFVFSDKLRENLLLSQYTRNTCKQIDKNFSVDGVTEIFYFLSF